MEEGALGMHSDGNDGRWGRVFHDFLQRESTIGIVGTRFSVLQSHAARPYDGLFFASHPSWDRHPGNYTASPEL